MKRDFVATVLKDKNTIPAARLANQIFDRGALEDLKLRRYRV